MEITFGAKVLAAGEPHRWRAGVYLVIGVTMAALCVLLVTRSNMMALWFGIFALGAFVAARGDLKPTLTSQAMGWMSFDGRQLKVALPASAQLDGRLVDQVFAVRATDACRLTVSHNRVRLVAGPVQVSAYLAGDLVNSRVSDDESISFLTDDQGTNAIRSFCKAVGIRVQG